MPDIRSVDDQTYEEIIEQAKSRIPWLCAAWTNHNASDPGITILELMAWYKELQQYYMDQTTPAVYRALLKLAGIVPEGPHAAACVIEAAPGSRAYLEGERLESPQGVPFELAEPIPVLKTELAALRVERDGVSHDVYTLNAGDASFRPFAFTTAGEEVGKARIDVAALFGTASKASGPRAAGGGPTAGQNGPFQTADGSSLPRTPDGSSLSRTTDGSSLPRTPDGQQLPGEENTQRSSVLRLGFSGKQSEELRLWFDVTEPEGSRRNPIDGAAVPPRTLRWEMGDCDAVEPIQDDTWCLSWSGYVTLPVPSGWQPGEDGLYWLTVRQTEGGCEEEVRLSGVSSNRYRCIQRETLVRRYSFHVRSRGNLELPLTNAQAQDAEAAVFLRTRHGWEQAESYRSAFSTGRRCLLLDTSDCVQDDADNLMVVCQGVLNPLLYSTKGIPEERLRLNVDGRRVLELELICQTLETDGTVQPVIWTRTEDLSVCGPRDCKFVWDEKREEIAFGDGLHGAVPVPGTGSVMVSSLALSACEGGNLPAGAGLTFVEDGTRVENGAASGGRDGETLDEARGRLLRTLADTGKCLSAADFVRCAMRTPGLRLAGAKAIPGYDPKQGAEQRRAAYVSVLVLPASETAWPVPDERFLAAVNRQLWRFRPVCVQARAIPPRYIPIDLRAEVIVQDGTDLAALETALRQWLRPRASLAGSVIRRNDAAAVLQKQVIYVRRVELRSTGAGGYVTAAGDLRLPPDGLPALETVEIELAQG